MEQTDPASVSVTVVRTGGFAGIRREWIARPAEPDRPHWVSLILGCPWDVAEASDPVGVDRFTWRIEAQVGKDARRAEMPETRLHGPWRDLVAEVQSFEKERDA